MDLALTNRRRITWILLTFGIGWIVLGLFGTQNTIPEVLDGLLKILTSPGILITDYIALANLGAAMVNVGLVTLIALAIPYIIKGKFTGYLLAGAFTMMGFAFFGKNPLNILPIFLGIFIFGKVAKRDQADLLAPYLFGTTLGPLVGQLAFGFEQFTPLAGGLLALGFGALAGFLLAALMGHVYSIHLGYNLYNTGTTAGFVGTVAYMMMRGFGLEVTAAGYWDTENTIYLAIVSGAACFVLIALGLIWGADGENFKKIIRETGKLSTDFVEIAGLPTTLVNMGIIGLIGVGYVLFVKGDLNGATMAGVLTIVAFGALGKHIRNIVPIMLGVYLMCFIKVWDHTDKGPMLAALFCTTLAPIAGQWGWLAGILVGAIHLPMVMHVGGLHGYMNLYNNGFAGGLAMLVVIGLVKGLHPEMLDLHMPWYLLRAPHISGDAIVEADNNAGD